ncbi:DNA repair protein RAD51 homolog 2-like isoform X1 [Branchiostoma floridae]|uniref:DNA repair protein RAD51 homolog 2 n=1 Tax=Branchiostoma floridae TaxID=7739 RepID=A0A9J7LM55_BRAFL|nr:DNA repair protein RAD51 homolog 2-like isoform X1 [Branchiostoma floridae]XP_035685475.1 DNA repair protein RAD51 homolog 2-like isoform X1 [Branchiostoma floridae]
MSLRKLRRLGLEPELVDRLERHKKLSSCQDILVKIHLELLHLTNLTHSDVQKIVMTASRACAPTTTTALQMKEAGVSSGSASFFSTSLSGLDQALHGGIPAGSVTEIAGPAGCGKTQFCVMLSVLATLPCEMGGLGGAVVYIDTESAFSAERLVEVAQFRCPQHFSSDDAFYKLTSQVFVHKTPTCTDLWNRLQSLEEELIQKRVRLVILDSVASVVRKEFDNSLRGNLSQRVKLLAKEAALLKYLAESLNIPVVVTNQITTRFKASWEGPHYDVPSGDVADGNGAGASAAVDGGYVTAALGNTWSHSVNTRLIVQYLDDKHREVMVAKSPIAPFSSFVYTIQSSGIVLQDDETIHKSSERVATDPGLIPIKVRTMLGQGGGLVVP